MSAATEWNPTQRVTFDYVRYVDSGTTLTLSFDDFHALPLDRRVRLLLACRPVFFFRGREIPKAQALERRA